MNLDKIFLRMLRRTICVVEFFNPTNRERYYDITEDTCERLTDLGEDLVIKFTEIFFRKVTGFTGEIQWQVGGALCDGHEGESEPYSPIIRVPRKRWIDLEFVDTLLHEMFHKTQVEWSVEDDEEEFLRDSIIEGDVPNLVSKLKSRNYSIPDFLYYGSWSEFQAIKFAFDHTFECVNEILKKKP